MPLTNGNYGTIDIPSRWGRLKHRWYWLRANLRFLLTHPRHHPEDSRVGYTLHREWGVWVVRPASGWRSCRWITPPVHATHSVPRNDRDAALEWAMTILGI